MTAARSGWPGCKLGSVQDLRFDYRVILAVLASREWWLPIPGFGELYFASSFGRIWSAPRPRTTGGFIRETKDNKGRCSVRLSVQGKPKTYRVHRLVTLAFYGPCPPGLQVCHWNGHADDNRVVNLRYGTPSSNTLDSVRHGTNYWATRKSCKHGHLYVPGSFSWAKSRRGNPYRLCLVCHRINGRRAEEKRKKGQTCS
jgi:hypothetical protein